MAVSPAPPLPSSPASSGGEGEVCPRPRATPHRPATAPRRARPGARPRPAVTDGGSTADGWRATGAPSTRVSALRGGGGGGAGASEGSVLGAPAGRKRVITPPSPASAHAGRGGGGGSGNDSDGSVGGAPPAARRRRVGEGVGDVPVRVQASADPGTLNEAARHPAEAPAGPWPADVCPTIAATLAGPPVPGRVVMPTGLGRGDGVGPEGRGFEA